MIFAACAVVVQAQQTLTSDLQLIDHEFRHQPAATDRIVRFPQPGKNGFWAKYNPVSLSFRSLLFGYQQLISVQFYAECLYSPSCSDFSKQLIHDHGLVRGTLGSADRLTRCNPLSDNDNPVWKKSRTDGRVHESTTIYIREK